MRGPQHLFLLALTLISLHPAIHVAGFSNSDNGNRRILHEPLYPLADTPPPPAEPPPVPETPNIPATDPPFVSLVPNGPGSNPTQTIAAPANVSTAVPSANSAGKIAMAISGSLAAIVLLSALVFFMYRHRIKNPTGSEKLFSGRGRRNRSENPRAPPETSTTSEFLYIGTLEPSQRRHSEPNGSSPYHKLSSNGRSELHQPSPELQPLPPLTGKPRRLSPVAMSSDEEQFYSPQGSVGGNHESPYSLVPRRHLPVFRSASTATKGVETSKSTPLPSSASAEPTFSISAIGVKHVDIPNPPPPPPPLQKTPVPCTQPKTPSPPKRRSKFSSPPSPPRNLSLPPLHDQPPRIEKISRSLPAPPPPPPPMAFRPPQPPPGKTRAPEPRVPSLPTRILARPQPLMPTPMAVKPAPVAEVNHGESSSERIDAADNRDSNKPRLKPLHWDKVRASSDRVMVWDQLKSSSFQINEDMIETLFVCNSADSVQKEAPRRPVLPAAEQGNRVLDPKKSQNIAILLRALNVTREEVCEALLDGNPDGFGAELLETMVKMAPTKEEELRLKEYRGDISKLGSAERFLKAVLDIPFAFKRVDAMLYRANFDAEVKYLRKSFESIEAACGELKNSRLFLKLLEAVLRTGNRMNVGTNRGDAQAFKLDTLLKLADVKGTDGKTTLLHFVVQEITRSEGSGLCSNKEMLASNPTQENLPNKQHPKVHEDDFKKQGLRVVAGLSTELSNVKKAAGMDSDVLSSYVSKLAMGLDKINQVLLLTNSERDNKNSNPQGKFFDLMKLFLNEAKEEIARVKAEEKKVLLLVKGITEYFHGDTAKEEAHPFRIFMIVRDFLSVLDQVCKEVGQMQERTTVYSSRSFRISASAPLPVFPRLSGNREGSSDTDSSSP